MWFTYSFKFNSSCSAHMLHSISHLINRNTFTYQKYVSFETQNFSTHLSSLLLNRSPLPLSWILKYYIYKSSYFTYITPYLHYITNLKNRRETKVWKFPMEIGMIGFRMVDSEEDEVSDHWNGSLEAQCKKVTSLIIN